MTAKAPKSLVRGRLVETERLRHTEEFMGRGGEDDSWRENWGKCPSVLHVFVREEMRTGAHEETLKQKNREKGRVEPLLGD